MNDASLTKSLSLLTPDGVTTFSSLQPGGESWSVLRARFDPWLVAEAEKEGVECIPGATVDALYEEKRQSLWRYLW
ncbi:putative FAD-dependent oxidoreductase [Escherichia coli]|uniref:Protein FixC n=1 Tax=Escherichia coli TaxID=562 RepID=A0A377BZ34_ECOLX|nr:putative FAD-dependent oxidoreductase [Escherichia coli]